MKKFDHGSGKYGYTYVLIIPIAGKKPVKEKHTFKFDDERRRDDAFRLAKQSIKNSEGWRKIG